MADEGRGRFGLGDLGRWAAGGVRRARETVAEVRQAYQDVVSNVSEIDKVQPLFPDQRIRHVASSGLQVAWEYGANGRLRDDIAGTLDPRALFGLLNIVNPAAWLEAVISPFRLAAELAALPGLAAAAAVRTADGRVAHAPLTPEQEAFRVAFGLSRDEPLADQLAAISHRYRYSCGGGLETPAGALLLLAVTSEHIKLAVSDTHLHAVELADQPVGSAAERPDDRVPIVRWSVERRRIARVDGQYGDRRVAGFPLVIVFDDGSWLRFLAGDDTRPEHRHFLEAIQEIPGDRPDL